MLTDADTEALARRVGALLADDAEFAATLPDKDVCAAILSPDVGWVGIMRLIAEGYADRPALGQRATEIVDVDGRPAVGVLERYDTVTYGELWERVTAVAAVFAAAGVQPGDRIATLGFCSVDYTTVDMAVPLLAGVSVPLHAGAPAGQLLPMVQETRPTVIACSAEYLEVGVVLAEAVGPALMVVFDHHPELDAHRVALRTAQSRLGASAQPVVVETLAQTIERGRTLPVPPDPESDPDRLAAIVYTSGSSGSPKGAMQPESLTQAIWTLTAGILAERGFALPAITLNYLPMSHTAGRAMLYSTLGAGGVASFASKSDMSTILDDLALVRPTQLNFVPRVWEMLYRQFLGECRRSGSEVAEEDVLADLRTRVLGGRYVTALTGSAPIAADLAAWVETLLGSHLMNAFGATETGSLIIDGRIQRPPVSDYKLVDVPELGYFKTDKPYPRGELLVKSHTLFRGYYKREALTAEVFDEDGFYRTGDIVTELGPDDVHYVDRRNNVLKLSQGEFVAVSKLESLYVNCPPVEQIYVYGNSERSFLLAVVVPTEELRNHHQDPDVKRQILDSLRNAARDAELETYEIPRDIVVEPDPFTLDNGLLSGIRKPSRPALKAKYAPRLEQLYVELSDAHDQRLRTLSERSADSPIIDIVRGVAGSLLGTATDDPPASARFNDLGGDSLSALTFANALEDIFDVAVPVGVIVSPASDLHAIADLIRDERTSQSSRPTFGSVHGTDATEIAASDLTLDKFVETSILDGVRSLAPPARDVTTVLLTGATGYLGRFLLIDWLDRVSAVNGKVVCLVRAKDDEAARRRLDSVFDSGDADLLSRYSGMAAPHLEVIAGDKGAADLGLDHTTWQRLAGEVDLIVDPAAMVNHMLPYQQLFAPNVVGTAELIRLALTVRQKPLAFVSSIGVGAVIPFGEFTEDADVRRVGARRSLGDDYASGYASSKWAGEVLLHEAHDLCGLPVTVFRCDMIMAGGNYRGQLNVPDMVTRLILSVTATGLAPYSFYQLDEHGNRPRAHFDGLPVDFVADAISTLTAAHHRVGFRTFHVVNPHDDGIGLDQYVDWMIRAGRQVERIRDYKEWHSRFETALRNLPERQRQASLLPLLTSFRYPQPALAGAFAPTDRFRAAVAQFGLGAAGDIPHIDFGIIEKYLSDLELLGLLDTEHYHRD
ncbi:Carboxylic acid reductase [Mycolicibacterium vanbaalenii]|uniref:Carboxylic acid reductase n=1 Tax=Mycolicibacterium vanbaalenii TaxID=110539 RepID=A0A5S9NMT1_MYCVN|nr:carboxylic acid reductase [Mycolicibacterium vanbaalenii]CAA0091724.1 Carboxylic acid reductase [Mycolicibacterium vanbaalenii]